MLNVNVCTVCFFMDAIATVKLDNKLFLTKKIYKSVATKMNYPDVPKLFFFFNYFKIDILL